MSEALLLKSVARGDQRAFEELYRRYYRPLARFLATRIPRSHSADELTNPLVDPRRTDEVRQWLTAGLGRLPDKQRLSLVLTHHFGHSVEQAALMANCPVGTMKARMCRAREQLRLHLNAIQ